MADPAVGELLCLDMVRLDQLAAMHGVVVPNPDNRAFDRVE